MKEIEESLVLNMGTSLILGDFVSYGTWGEKIDIYFAWYWAVIPTKNFEWLLQIELFK